MNTTSFASLSKSNAVKHIWANKSENGFNGKLADLKMLSEEELEPFYNAFPIVESDEQTVSTDTVEQVSGITARITSKGEQYFTIGLPLVETNGLSFRFAFGDKIVLVANDVDLYKIHKETPIAIGTVIEFNYDGADTFKQLTADLLVANNNAENRYRGTISKSANEIFALRLIQKEEKRMQKTIAVMETAEELGITTRKVRTVMSANLNTDIIAKMKAKVG
jgi:hypothetical protein